MISKLLEKIPVVTCVWLLCIFSMQANGQTLAFPGAEGFGRFATGARGHADPQIYVVSNLNDSGPGSFRDAVSQPGRFVVFAVGGIIRLESPINVAPYTTIAGQTAPGDGVVIYGRRVSFTGASHSIARHLRIRMGADAGAGKNEDASGVSNGSNIIFDHLSFSWGLDEVFSINWDGKGLDPDSITIQNSIIGQGLHRHNHSAGGLIQPGGKISILKSLYISNKTRNPKVKGINEFVNNVVYNYGNIGNPHGHSESGDGYIMGGSEGVSEVNIMHNYFIAGPNTPDEATPFSRGTPTFFLHAAGNYWDRNKNGSLDGQLVPQDGSGYPGVPAANFQAAPYPYPGSATALGAEEALAWVKEHVGATYPRRDQVDELMIADLSSHGANAHYVYRESELPLSNGGLGDVYAAPAPEDTDGDGIPDQWEDDHGLDKNDPADALLASTSQTGYLNIEVYINSLVEGDAPDFVKPPVDISFDASSTEEPVASTVVLHWNDNGNESGQVVIERSDDGEAYTALASVAAGTQTYTDAENLLPDMTYYYRLKVVSDEGESAYAVRTVTTPPIPTAPGRTGQPQPQHEYAYVTLGADNGVELAWSGTENTESYLLFLGTDPDNLSQVAEVDHVEAPRYIVTDLLAGTEYWWRVDAVNDKGTATGEVWSFRTTTVFADALVGHWAFDEEDGDRTVLDASSFANHGSLGFDDDAAGVRIEGIAGRAVNLSDVDASMYPINIPHADHLFLGEQSFSVAFWMKAAPDLLPPDNNSSAYLLCKGSITRNETTGATGKRFNIEFKNKQLRFAIDDDAGKDELQVDGTPFFSDSWIHVVAIRDTENKKLKLYRNGVAVGETDISKALGNIGEASDLIIGNIGEFEFLDSKNAPAPYRGQLDELKLFNYVLSDDEIVADYAAHAGLQKVRDGQQTPTTNQADVQWSGGDGASTFAVYLGTSAENLDKVADLSVTTYTYEFTDLQPATTYYWRIDALAADDEVATGDVWEFTTTGLAEPQGELVGLYRLDETSGTTVADASAYANHGTLQDFAAEPWISDGKQGRAIQFETTAPTGAIVVPAAAQNAFDENSFTISMWMRAPENTYKPSENNAYLIQKGTFSGVGKWYGVQLNHSDRLVFAVDDNVTKSEVRVDVADVDLYNGEWRHVVAVRDRDADKLRIYVDGVLAAEADDNTEEGIAQEDLDLLIGNSAESRPYRDALDEVRLYNYALSESEITDLFDGKIEQGIMVAHYELNETSGGMALDASTFANHATLRDFADSPWGVAGKFGGAIHYETTAPTGAIVVPAAAQNAFDENSFTISMWMRAPENTYMPSENNAYLIQKGTFGGVGKWYGVQLSHSSQLVFAVDDNATKSEVRVGVDDVDLYNGQWKHVVAVRDRDAVKLRIYIDGVLAAEADDKTEGGIAQEDLDLLIGNSAENRPYRDDLDDVRLYNYALSADEIAALFSPPVEEADLVADYRFDEGAGLQVRDATEYENHGALDAIGATPWATEGKENGALDFKDNTERGALRIPAAEQIKFDNSSFTLSFWVRGTDVNLPQDNNSSAYLLCKGSIGRNENTGASGKRYNIELKNKQLRFAIDDDNDANGGGKDEVQVDGVPFFTGEWVHVVAVRDADNKRLKIYRDGELVGDREITKALSGIGEDTELIIGNVGALELSNPERGTAPYTGQLDGLKIYARALTDAEVARVTEGKPVLKSATYISPENGAMDVPVDGTAFVWEGIASSYTLYLGTDASAMEPVAENLEGGAYTPEAPLEFSTTYFWRVDALIDGDLIEGETWSFATEVKPVPVVFTDTVYSIKQYTAADAIVARLQAETPEGESLFDWEITQNADVNGNGQDAFTLDAVTGDLVVNDSTDLDYTEGQVLEIKVRVSNNAGASDEATIQLVVVFVNTPPAFDAIADVAECFSPEQKTLQITGINAGLEEGQTVELSVAANPSRMFHALEITQPENGEAYLTYTPKAGIDDSVAVTIKAKDDGGLENDGQDTYQQTFVLTIASPPEIAIFADKARVQKGEIARLTVQNNSRTRITHWNYDFEFDELPGSEYLIVKPTETTTYTIGAENALGCADEASITIEVYEPAELEATNVITPNGDGINDTWVVKNIEYYPGNSVKVFDVSGRVVYQAKDYRNDWNGTYQGKALADGTYYFVIDYGDGRQPQKGYINIINDNR